MRSKVIIVSNRGPNDFVWDVDHWVARTASGGLVSMIDPLARRSDVSWFCCVSESPSASQARKALFTTASDQTDPEHHIIPVPLPTRIYQDYYASISNEVLWMLQHHLVGQFGYSSLNQKRHRAWAAGYLEANSRIAEAITKSDIAPRAFLIQDYHLYPLPALLRKAYPKVPSVHFTHIPFPDAATLKLIPKSWRETILNGLIGADVVGLQTQSDTRSFLSCCRELLDIKVNLKTGRVYAVDGRVVKVRSYAASTDPTAVRSLMRSADVVAARERFSLWGGWTGSEAKGKNRQTIVRVDRLDPSKNQIIGFRAFGRLLEKRPDLCGRIRFLAFLVPSRTDLGVYRDYRDAVYSTIADVNRRFSPDSNDEVIKVFYTNNREQALAAMEQCDVLLANSREDGMNLVVKEWAVVSKRPGAVIVSETAGVAVSFQKEALLVSPLDIEGTALALEDAIEMCLGERANRLKRMRQSVTSWTATDWLKGQLTEIRCDL